MLMQERIAPHDCLIWHQRSALLPHPESQSQSRRAGLRKARLTSDSTLHTCRLRSGDEDRDHDLEFCNLQSKVRWVRWRGRTLYTVVQCAVFWATLVHRQVLDMDIHYPLTTIQPLLPVQTAVVHNMHHLQCICNLHHKNIHTPYSFYCVFLSVQMSGLDRHLDRLGYSTLLIF